MKISDETRISLLIAALGVLAGALGGVLIAPLRKGVNISLSGDFSREGKPGRAFLTVKTGRASNRKRKLREIEKTVNKGMVQQ